MSLFGGTRAIWIEPAGDEIADGVDGAARGAGVRKPGGRHRRRAAQDVRPAQACREPSPRRWPMPPMSPKGRTPSGWSPRSAARFGLRIAPAGRGAARRRVRQRPGDRRARSSQSSRSISTPRRKRPRSSTMTRSTRSAPTCRRAISCGWPISRWPGGSASLPTSWRGFRAAAPKRIPVVRALQRRLLMLAPLRARIERGEALDAVMTSMGKSLFWKDKPLVAAAAVDVGCASGWRRPRSAPASSSGS